MEKFRSMELFTCDWSQKDQFQNVICINLNLKLKNKGMMNHLRTFFLLFLVRMNHRRNFWSSYQNLFDVLALIIYYLYFNLKCVFPLSGVSCLNIGQCKGSETVYRKFKMLCLFRTLHCTVDLLIN